MFLFEKSFYGFFFLLLSVQMLSWSLLHGNSCGASSFDDLSQQTPCLSTTRQVTSQDAPPTLQRTDSSSLTEHPKHTHLQTVLWAAALPLDLLKKASLSVLHAPHLFVATTSILFAAVSGQPSSGVVCKRLPPEDRAFLELSAIWDTTTCRGRALDHTQARAMRLQRPICRKEACTPHVTFLCAGTLSNRTQITDTLRATLCSDTPCAPHAISREARTIIRYTINACMQENCQQTGVPHAGHFTCVVSKKKMHNARKREQIDQKIFALERCFDQFCQMHAKKECPKVPALWQSLSGQPPCNEDLCPGRFVPNETKETSLGVFKTLEEIGREAIENCQMQQRRQGASPLALFEQQHCEDACVAKAITF